MVICTNIIIIFLLLIVIFQLVELKGIMSKGSGGDTVSISGLIEKLEKMTTQIKGFIK